MAGNYPLPDSSLLRLNRSGTSWPIASKNGGAPNPGTVLAWDEGRRFAYSDAFVDDLMTNGPFMVGIWSIEAEGEGTRYTAISRHWTE